MKLWFLLLWPALVSSAALAQNTAQADSTSHFLSRVEVHFRLYRNYLIVVQGSLGLLDRLNFLVDTGTNPTALDRKIAKKLGLGGHPKQLDLLDQACR